MTTITAVFENGVFRPLQPVEGFESGTQVELNVIQGTTAWDRIKHLAGQIPQDEIDRIDAAVEEAFEQVDLSEW